MRLVFCGTPQFAVPSLKYLIVQPDFEILSVYTQPDRPRGRGQEVSFSPVKEVAITYGLAVWQPPRLSEREFLVCLEDLLADVIVVAAFGQILPPAVLKLPRYGCINVHASLLPKYRGAAPIHRAIMNGEKETGITTIFMNEGLDTGDILLQQALPITEEDTAGTLHDRLARLGAELLVKTLSLLSSGRLICRQQDHAKATYAPVISRADELIKWDASARSVFNQVRGLNPWPGAATTWKEQLLKIWQVEVAKGESLLTGAMPGQVRVADPEQGLLIQANPGLVLVKELQLQGGKRMYIKEFLRGHPIAVGTILDSSVIGYSKSINIIRHTGR
ncbi:MAG: methionyl-tRNA formyltransferase [Firmicutes bacterium]|nr:methionyl-tRNA formyltransferase [Bacillota bacterium]